MPTIGILTNDEKRVFQQSVIKGVRITADAIACDLIVDSRVDNSSTKLTPGDADGFLVIANAATPEFLEAARRAQKPITLISHCHPDHPSVVFDNRHGIMELVRHVAIECNRPDIVFVRGISGQYDAEQREVGFKDALMRYSVGTAGFITGEFDPDKAIRSLYDYIKEEHVFNAVIASDYKMALAVIDMLEQMNYHVPENISVVGFGDTIEAREAGLTTVAADVEELGKRAARQLLHQMNGAIINGVTTLSVRLIERNTSCYAPPVNIRKHKYPRFKKKIRPK